MKFTFVCLLFFIGIIFPNKLDANNSYLDSTLNMLEQSVSVKPTNGALYRKVLERINSIPANRENFQLMKTACEKYVNTKASDYHYILKMLVFQKFLLPEFFEAEIEFGKKTIEEEIFYKTSIQKACFSQVFADLRIPFRNTNKIFEGFEYITGKLDYFLQKHDSEEISNCYFVLGGFNFTLGLTNPAIYNFKKALNYIDSNKSIDTSVIISSPFEGIKGWQNHTSVIGMFYLDEKNYEEALHYLKASLNALTTNSVFRKDHPNRNFIYCNIANAKMLSGITDNVEYYLNLAIINYTNDYDNLAYALQLKGFYNYKINRLDSAEKYLLACKELFIKYNLVANGTSGNNIPGYHLALVRMKQKRYRDAIQCIKEELPRLSNLRSVKIDELKLLAEAYKADGDEKKALQYYEDCFLLEEQLQTDERKNLSISFEVEKKIAESEETISALQTDKKMAAINKNYLIGIACLLFIIALVLFNRFRIIRRQKLLIEKEKQRSDTLLLNILPAEVAEELKAKGSSEAKDYERVTVMFTDFKDFTKISEKLSPGKIVEEINYCFSEFDKIIEKHGIEKIKTIGDAYMCAGGLPIKNNTHALDVVNAAVEIREFMATLNSKKVRNGEIPFEIRIGINTGHVVAGIVGVKKFAYDIWGDAVNIAARMEQNSDAGKINISGTTYDLIKKNFNCMYRGKIEAKNKGEIDMYFVL